MNKAGLQRLNGNTLKIIACIIMLIDHLGAAIIMPLNNGGFLPFSPFNRLNTVYRIIRAIGRTSFPIFCFLLVEGFTHTRSKFRYGLSLLIFGFISELPYDLAMNDQFFDMSDNNVFFTLFLGFLVMASIEFIQNFFSEKKLPAAISYVLCIVVTAGIGYLAHILNTDYSYRGVGLIAFFYIFRFFEPLNLITGYLILCTNAKEIYAFPAMILILMYNKKRGKNLGRYKYLFYAFYPAHLLILFLIRILLVRTVL